MRRVRATILGVLALSAAAFFGASNAFGQEQGHNPTIWADVPDVAVLRVGELYYMSSTTMHMNPGVPIMRSSNLADWELISYAYETLEDNDALALRNGQNAYGAGSWASSLRYHDGKFYCVTFSGTTGKTYVFSTTDPAGKWDVQSFRPAFHDCSLFFDDDGRKYLIHSSGNIRITELKDDLSGVKEGGVNQVLFGNDTNSQPGLQEGSQVFKHDGKYYVTNITWPRGDMRTQVMHRSDNLLGPYEGREVVKDRGIAQGTYFDLPNGEWAVMLFQDAGAVGRIPYVSKVEWVDGWPTLPDGKFPEITPFRHDEGRASEGLAALGNIVGGDEFDGKYSLDDVLAMGPWQWNHNPVAENWSLKAREGFLRITTGRVDAKHTDVRNMLTQRTFGPSCVGETKLELTGLKDGDLAGLCALQRRFGYVAVMKREGSLFVVQSQGNERNDSLIVNEMIALPDDTTSIQFRIRCDFRNRRDRAYFEFSTDGVEWKTIGKELQMIYSLPHFMGYRYALFVQSAQEAGGYADFDYFHIADGE